MSPDSLVRVVTLTVFAINAALATALVVLKAVHRRKIARREARRHEYIGVLSRHIAFENCTDPIPPEMAQDPAFLDALIDMRNAVTGKEVTRLQNILDRNAIVERQVKRLESLFLGTRLRAAVALAEIGDESAAPALMKHLDDREPEIRIQAARGLGRIKWTPAIDAIVWRFGIEDPWVRSRFSDTLVGFGTSATWPLIAYITVNHRFDSTGPSLAIRTLAQIQDHQAVEPLIELLGATTDLEVRIATVETLGELGNPQALHPLLDLLGDEHWELRSKSAKALGGIADPEAIPSLVAATHDPEWWVRRSAARALSHIPGGVEALYNVLDGTDARAADAVAEALADIGEVVAARQRLDEGQSDGEPLLDHMAGSGATT